MAVIDGASYYPTERIIRKSLRKHYRIPVKSQHWQLRSLISTEQNNIVYFPGGNGSNHVQRLNTQTSECETIKLLSFSPRCLTAGSGWVCCGGETGEFTAIQVDEGADGGSVDLPLDLHLDARLHQDAESSQGDSTISSIITQSRRLLGRSSKSLMAKSQKLARDRVNCITLWFPPTHLRTHHGAYTEPVAVLANNDKSVVLVGLRDFDSQEKAEPLDVITYPDYVNRAIISPDGRLLIAILDDPYLYVHERVEKPADDQGSFSSRDKPEYQWEQRQKLLLQSQRQDDTSDSRGSFAACFSRSGAYLAVGTQYGTISVFDTRGFTNRDMDPLMTSFKSSKPMTGAGAVRDMAFCPGPFDLLAWTEDRGHIGIADVRSGFVQRQILDIGSKDFEQISILDRNTIDPRLLEGRGERSEALASNLSSSLSLSESRRRRDPEGLDRHPYPLTPDETRVLEALQDERRRREQRDRIIARMAQHGAANISALPQLPSTPWGGRLPADIADDAGLRPPRERSSSVSRALRERTREQLRDGNTSVSRAIGDLLGNIRDHRERAQERARSAQRLLLDGDVTRERRQAVPPPPRSTSTRPGETTAAVVRGTGGPRPSSSALYGGLPAPGGVWADMESLYNLSFESNLYEARSSDVPIEETFLPYLAHAGHVSARARWEDGAAVRRRTVAADPGVHESPPEPDNTAGLSWSEDGRILFVGAENGIYEFHVDVQGRKYYPNVTMR